MFTLYVLPPNGVIRIYATGGKVTMVGLKMISISKKGSNANNAQNDTTHTKT